MFPVVGESIPSHVDGIRSSSHQNILPVFVQVAEVQQVLAPHLGDKHELQCVTDDKVRSSVLLSAPVVSDVCLYSSNNSLTTSSIIFYVFLRL